MSSRAIQDNSSCVSRAAAAVWLAGGSGSPGGGGSGAAGKSALTKPRRSLRLELVRALTGEDADGHQVALRGLSEITVTPVSLGPVVNLSRREESPLPPGWLPRLSPNVQNS